MNKINLEEKIRQINGKVWRPVEIARMNNQVAKLAFMKGEYRWHMHQNEDELFYVVEGNLTIAVGVGSDIKLKANEIVVIPKGMRHCPKSSKGAYVLMFEPIKLRSISD